MINILFSILFKFISDSAFKSNNKDHLKLIFFYLRYGQPINKQIVTVQYLRRMDLNLYTLCLPTQITQILWLTQKYGLKYLKSTRCLQIQTPTL